MKQDIFVNSLIIIPEHEFEISTSRAGGPGGQHVNKTDTRITVRWNIRNSNVLTIEQKERLLEKLHAQLTIEGDLIIHNSTSRSQQHNKKAALVTLVEKVRQALFIPKKRMKTRVSRGAQEKRLASKARHGALKKARGSGVWE